MIPVSHQFCEPVWMINTENVGYPRPKSASDNSLRATRQGRSSPPRDLSDPQDVEKQHGGPNDPTQTEKTAPRSPLKPSPLPALRPLKDRFSREEITTELLDLTEQVASVALSGPVGVGKSSVALTILHHDQIKVKFGRNRHFMRCDDLTNSLEGFLERLSDAVGTGRTTDTGQLRSHLESLPPLILLLDGVDSILDPLAPEAEKISATIEEFGCYQNVCLLTTSRMCPEIPGFHRVEVPTLSGDAARDAFHGLCHLDRSSAVDALLTELDFHPLSIDLLANSVRKNSWDETALLKALSDDQTGVLKTQYYQHMRDAIERSFRSPTLRSLGDAARDALAAIARSPCGVEECGLESIVPGMAGVEEAVDVLCKFSLVYRQGGFVKMLSPLRFYFLEFTSELGQHAGISCGKDNICRAARGGLSISLLLFYGHAVTVLEVFPICTQGPPDTKVSKIPRAIRRPARESWIKRLQAVRKSGQNDSYSCVTALIYCLVALLALFGRPRGSANVGIVQTDPAKTPSVHVQQSSPAPVAPSNLPDMQEVPVNTPPTVHVQQSLTVVVAYQV